MSRHILIIERDIVFAAAAGPEDCVYPEHPDERDYNIECIPGNGCHGWQQCTQSHEVNGRHADDGPSPSSGSSDTQSRAPWHGHLEFEFHGQVHTWRDGHGWTVEYSGCIVNFNDSYELPHEAEDLPIGRYEVNDDWDDTSCYLQMIGPAPAG